MKQLFVIFILVTSSFPLAAQITVSGLLDSSVSMKAGAGDSPPFSYSVEEYANIRMQAKIRDQAIVYGAFNFIATAGDNTATVDLMGRQSPYKTDNISATPFASGQNYIAAIELERLYFRLSGDVIDFDGGLLRLPFGYGQVWGPSDFLNPRNPLIPDARPRAVLGGGLSWYPVDSLKLLFFGAAPRDPFAQSGEGGLGGLSMDQDWDKASLQLLYAFESPQTDSQYGIHRAGISVKADVEVGLVMDALYTYNHEAGTELNGLSFSAGADYSFFDSKLLVMAEYLYNGGASSTSIKSGGSFSNENYLYTGFTWSFNDFTSMTAALISGFDDVCFTPIISLNHDLFQGATLTVSAQVPLDRDLFADDGNRGELGPLSPLGGNKGRYFDFSAKLRLRF